MIDRQKEMEEFIRRTEEGKPQSSAYQLAQALVRIASLEAENARLREGLESIAKNTCCDSCREAALVARDTLRRAGMEEGR